MRVKTDARRRAIVAAAWTVFQENGFERTTMSEISDRVGGSKATLYGYFKSKDELFAAALDQAIRERSEEMFARMGSAGELRARLSTFARAYMEARLSPEMIGVNRALIAEAERSNLSAKFMTELYVPHWRRFAAVLEQEMAAGRLFKGEPYLAAMQFRGLIEADVAERRLHGDASLTQAEINAAVEAGVDVFLRAYAP